MGRAPWHEDWTTPFTRSARAFRSLAPLCRGGPHGSPGAVDPGWLEQLSLSAFRPPSVLLTRDPSGPPVGHGPWVNELHDANGAGVWEGRMGG